MPSSVFLYFFDHVFLFLRFVLHNLHFGSQNTSSQEISTDQKFIPLGKVWQRTRAKAKHCDGRNPTISRRHNLNFQTSIGNKSKNFCLPKVISLAFVGWPALDFQLTWRACLQSFLLSRQSSYCQSTQH